MTDAEHLVLGIVTAPDIPGEKSMRLVQDRGARHADILVRDVLTPREGTEALPLENVLVKVGHIAATLRTDSPGSRR